jgi:drug/metabolite transporter (DMT)-like permease
MSLQRPTTATASIWLAVGVLVLSGVSAVLTVVFRDEVLAAWRAGRDDSSSIEQPAFVPVALVMYVVVALLMWVLLMFFREGHNWARRSIVALFLLMGVGILAVLRTEPPTVFFVLCGLTLIVDLVAVGCLLHKDTRTWCHEEVPV